MAQSLVSIKTTMVVDDRILVKLIASCMRQGKVVRIIADGVHYGIIQELKGNPFMGPAVAANRVTYYRAWKKVKLMEPRFAVKLVDWTSLAIERDAKALAPVDTGALRSSIHIIKGEQYTHTFRTLSGGA